MLVALKKASPDEHYCSVCDTISPANTPTVKFHTSADAGGWNLDDEFFVCLMCLTKTALGFD
jgi:hypothetical protein